ncbi:DMT family protein [Bdellovibrio sp. HCB209]|uniref:DMT family protein n=1 Tax=Bdellovibrio sp. HCB209 TaxID=3394354 RepID=UPI0039B50837
MLQYVSPVVLLLISNIFMTFAWYGHLKSLKSSALWIAIAVSWGIALFEYIFQVPANRMGAEVYTLPQLKIIQEVITMVVFAGFSYWYMGQPLKMDYLYAGLCLVGAVYFLFR